MHQLVWVLGDEPEQQVKNAMPEADWCAIGGRWTGYLTLDPGAEGKVYGRAIPEMEAEMMAQLGGEGSSLGTIVAGDGVDQARLGDVDPSKTGIHMPIHLVVDGVLHKPPEGDFETLMMHGVYEMTRKLGKGGAIDPDELEADADKAWRRWSSQVADILSHQDSDKLLTIVDAHV